MQLSHLTLLTTLLATVADAETLKLLAQNLDTHTSTPIGTLNHNEETKEAEIVDGVDTLEAGAYRFGVQKGPQFMSYGYAELSQPFGYDVVITTKSTGEIATVSFKKSSARGLRPLVKTISPGPTPFITQKKEKQEIKNPLEPAEEENKSFIQKYWMYLVPVAILFLMSPGDKEGGASSQ